MIEIGFSLKEILNLPVLVGIDYITDAESEKMIFQAELLMSNGVDVFGKDKKKKSKGLERYIDFFDATERYHKGKEKDLSKPEKKIIIDATNNFLKG